jgi:hypothetical protein
MMEIRQIFAIGAHTASGLLILESFSDGDHRKGDPAEQPHRIGASKRAFL